MDLDILSIQSLFPKNNFVTVASLLALVPVVVVLEVGPTGETAIVWAFHVAFVPLALLVFFLLLEE
jgi:hypothetical protein